MGKKVKRKARNAVKDKQSSVASPNLISQENIQKVDTPENAVIVVNDRKVCPHIDKGIDVDKVSAKLGSSEPVRCEDCREGAVDRRAGRAKGKHGKKKGGGESKLESGAIWICLECGHFSCGGAGFPTTPQSHAVRHARQYRHSLAIQFGKPQLRWCFPCNTLIPAGKVEEGSEQKDVFQDIVKMIKRRPSEGPSLDAEDVWFGNGSVTCGVKSELSVSVGANGKGGYAVRGLVNLGNTCFFNSIMQNLLAMNRLRDYFLKLDNCVGSLTASLKKLFDETSPDITLRNIINPKSFFGSVCAKAPQFRGYQQQDSHELLHCLLDGLSTEELTARKKIKSSQDHDKSACSYPTYVDDIFGGRLSSTVSCLDCGHSSLVYEPFLDLSLPVPTKKPPSRKAQSVSRAKKLKPPPKRSGRPRPKISRDTAPLNAQSAQENGGKSSAPVQSSEPVAEDMAVPSDNAMLNSIDAIADAENMGLTSLSLCSSQKSNDEQNVSGVTGQFNSMENFAWLDYLDQDILPNGEDVASQVDDIMTCQGSGTEDVVQPNVSAQNILDTHMDIQLSGGEKSFSPDDLMCVDDQEQSISPDLDIASQFSEKLLVKDLDAAEVEHSSASGSKILFVDLNLGTSPSTELRKDDAPLPVDGSDLLPPYEEETSTSNDILKGEDKMSSASVACEQDLVDFGVGDLFAEPEPEPVSGPAEKPLLNGAASESDPDEVDNTDAPVSVESCLAYFTKPELLSKTEHAWQCENCAKLLREKKIRLKKKLLKPRSCYPTSAQEDSNPSDTEMRTTNGSVKKGVPDAFDDTLYQNGADGYSNCIPETNLGADPDPLSLPSENGLQPSQDEACGIVSCDNQNNGVQLVEPELVSGNCESEESENEEMDSKSIKVERDATKRILIDRAPPILTIHLKRFSQDARGRLSKLSGHVNFRETIDLTTYVDPRCLNGKIYKYRLIGVVEHSGTMRGGHYIAYVRGGPKVAGKDNNDAEDSVWYYASDAYVREVPLEEVLRCEAYILFYEEI